MSSYLSNKANIILSTTSNPTSDQNAIEFSPMACKPAFDSLATEDSGRSDDGVMHIYWVKNRYRKLEITLRPDTPENISPILNKVMGKEYYITYWDIVDNQEETRKVYTSNASTDWYSGVIHNGYLKETTFSAIELAGENA